MKTPNNEKKILWKEAYSIPKDTVWIDVHTPSQDEFPLTSH